MQENSYSKIELASSLMKVDLSREKIKAELIEFFSVHPKGAISILVNIVDIDTNDTVTGEMPIKSVGDDCQMEELALKVLDKRMEEFGSLPTNFVVE